MKEGLFCNLGTTWSRLRGLGLLSRCARLAALKPLSYALRALARHNAFAADDSGVSSSAVWRFPSASAPIVRSRDFR